MKHPSIKNNSVRPDTARTSPCSSEAMAFGKHGRMMEMCCETSNVSMFKSVLCKLLESRLDKLEQVKLYQHQSTFMTLHTESDFKQLLQLFKHPARYGFRNIAVKNCFDKDSMMSDVDNAFTVDNEIYKDKKSKPFIQIKCLEFKSFKFTGMELIFKREKSSLFSSNKESLYYYFSQKCLKTVDQVPMDDGIMRTFIKDITDSLKILHKSGYYHGDIKTKNVMTCGEDSHHRTFNLIDWGRLYNISEFNPKYGYGGSTQAGSPLGFYLLQKKYKNPMALKVTLWYMDSRCYNELKAFPDFNDWIWPNIKESFTAMITSFEASQKPLSDLFNTYKYTLDLYNLGLTIIHLVLKNGLKIQSYERYLNLYCMYSHPSFSTSL